MQANREWLGLEPMRIHALSSELQCPADANKMLAGVGQCGPAMPHF